MYCMKRHAVCDQTDISPLPPLHIGSLYGKIVCSSICHPHLGKLAHFGIPSRPRPSSGPEDVTIGTTGQRTTADARKTVQIRLTNLHS